MVTHSISEACFMSDRVVVLSHRPGRITRIITIPLDRPRERSMTDTKAFVRICGMVRGFRFGWGTGGRYFNQRVTYSFDWSWEFGVISRIVG